MAEPIDIRTYRDEFRRRAEAFAAMTGADPGDPVKWSDPVRMSALGLGVARGLPIRMEIEERRERIRRAAALAEKLAEMAGGELIEITHPRPTTVAGIAVLRARRIQLRERIARDRLLALAAESYSIPRAIDFRGSAL